MRAAPCLGSAGRGAPHLRRGQRVPPAAVGGVRPARGHQFLQNVWDRCEYYCVIMHARRGGFAKESLAEHAQILKALEAGDPARAAKAMEHHRMRALRRLQQTT